MTFDCLLAEIAHKMEHNNLDKTSLSQIRAWLPCDRSFSLGDDFLIMDVTHDEKVRENARNFGDYCRFDGYLVLFCVKGALHVSVNMDDFEIRDNMMFFGVPGSIFRFEEIAGNTETDSRYIVVAMSRDFVSGLGINQHKLFSDGITLLDSPYLNLGGEDVKFAGRFLELLVNVLKSDSEYRMETVNSLLSSLFYYIAGVWKKHMAENNVITQGQSARGRMVFEQFIRLVGEHHVRYRNVGFYADKLCLTPKYLSKLIKTASGRSAPEWIDSYVVMEAKNLLKYSNITIKEIVYRLNFPNQSVFYKFFKARTGMTPSEYRNS